MEVPGGSGARGGQLELRQHVERLGVEHVQARAGGADAHRDQPPAAVEGDRAAEAADERREGPRRAPERPRAAVGVGLPRVVVQLAARVEGHERVLVADRHAPDRVADGGLAGELRQYGRRPARRDRCGGEGARGRAQRGAGHDPAECDADPPQLRATLPISRNIGVGWPRADGCGSNRPATARARADVRGGPGRRARWRGRRWAGW